MADPLPPWVPAPGITDELAGQPSSAGPPPPAWLAAAANLPPLPPLPPPDAQFGPQLGPQPFGAPPPGVDGPSPIAPPVGADGSIPAVLPPWGAPPTPSAPGPIVPPFGPAPAQHIGDLVDVSPEQPAPFAPTFVEPGDPTSVLPSQREDRAKDPFSTLTDEQAFKYTQDLALNHPEILAQLQAQHDIARRARSAADTAHTEEENQRKAEDDLRIYKDAQAKAQQQSDQIVADALALSKRPLDRGRWFRNLSTFGKIATGIGALVGGLMSKPGGPNLGVEFITKPIDDDINDQKYEIENARQGIQIRQGAVAQEFARTGDLYRATETVRAGAYQAALNKMQADAQNYDPRGTTILNGYAPRIQQMQAAIGASLDAHNKTRFEENYKLGQLSNELAKSAEERRKNLAAEALARQKEAREASKAKTEAQVYTPEQLRILNPGLAVPPLPLTQADYSKWLETQKHGEELKGVVRTNSPEERDREFAVGGVLDDKGEPIRFRSTTAADKIAGAKGSVDSAVGLIDKIALARQKYGWSSDLVRSPEWRQMQADYGALVLQKKNTDQLGVLSEGDMELIGKSLGTTDPTEARDPLPGLRSARSNMVENLNAQIRAQAALPKGRSPARWEPPAPPEIHANTPDETAEKHVLWNPLRSDDNIYAELGITPETYRGQISLDKEVAKRFREAGGILPSQRATIDAWTAALQSPSPDLDSEDVGKRKAATRLRDAAAAALQNAADTAELSGVRAYARQALTNTATIGIPESPAVDEPARETAHVTVQQFPHPYDGNR